MDWCDDYGDWVLCIFGFVSCYWFCGFVECKVGDIGDGVYWLVGLMCVYLGVGVDGGRVGGFYINGVY